MLLVAMLARLNTSPEVSILPTGLGNHYTSSSRHLIPPGRRRFPYNHSVSSTSDCFVGDPNAPEAKMSFREQQEYFGPDVLVIIGLVLASLGAILTLISFYCHFRHPAIQATMAGIGPSLVGIGMLFCFLRLFFCSFCISKTCCECIGDGLRWVIVRSPCCKCFRKPKKRIHPLQVRDIPMTKPTVNGHLAPKYPSSSKPVVSAPQQKGSSNGFAGGHSHGAILNNNHIQPPAGHTSLEMTSLSVRMDPISESDERRPPGADHAPEVREDDIPKAVDDILRDEMDLLEDLKSESSQESLHKNINELVLKTQPRY